APPSLSLSEMSLPVVGSYSYCLVEMVDPSALFSSSNLGFLLVGSKSVCFMDPSVYCISSDVHFPVAPSYLKRSADPSRRFNSRDVTFPVAGSYSVRSVPPLGYFLNLL